MSIVVIAWLRPYAGTMPTAPIPALVRLRNPVMPYAWGSHSALATLRGLPRSEQPEAELWVGAHHRAPSVALLPDGEHPLDSVLHERAPELLGADLAHRHQHRLPFLLKLLAVEQPLSIQVHPDTARAEAGWRREEAMGLAAADPRRSFPDGLGKPELFVALAPTTVLCGFRPTSAVDAHLRSVGLDDLPGRAPGERYLAWLRQGTDVDLHRALAALAGADIDPELSEHVRAFAALHPGDASALAPLFLHLVHLAPGDGLAVEPGTVHAAVRGFGVEVMAASDNVVRAGLTRKHRALEHFADLAVTEPREPQLVAAAREHSDWLRYPTAHPEFALAVAALDGTTVEVDGFAALLGVEGAIDVQAAGTSQTLTPGNALLVRADARATLSGHGRVFSCRVP